ncbi:MAG TPA: MFS transporter [Motilibacteraceae bacterium]|nr:MFS transporter [Motilibacteraceae bacterium]
MGALHERDFALLFAGQSVSVLGDRLVMVAMPFAVLSVPGAGAADVGLVLGASALTLALFVLVGGVWADRLPRHLTMLASDVVRAVAQGATAALLLTGHATVWRLVVLQAVFGAAEAFFRPAVLGLVPQVTRADRLQEANALLALTSNLALMVGPAVAGLLVATVGAGAALAIDAATFVVSALTLLPMRPHPIPAPDVGKSSFTDELRGGWHEVRGRSWVWSVILAFAAYHTFVLPGVFVLGPLVSEELRGGASSWGLISTGFGVGAALGSVLALRWRPHRPGVVIGVLLAVASSQAAICASPLPTLAVAALEAVTGVAVSVLFTVWETALQEHIPQAAQARVSSFDYLGSLTLMPLGLVVIGPLGHLIGNVPTAVLATGLSLTVSLLAAAGRPLRDLRPATPAPAGPAPRP